MKGLLSPEPDFSSTVPYAWDRFFKQAGLNKADERPHIGIIDLSASQIDGELIYWAGVEKTSESLSTHDALICKQLEIGACSYAVLPYRGDVDEFHKAVTWLTAMWLPESGYVTVDNAFEMEIYYPPFDSGHQSIIAEYWLPIVKQKAVIDVN
ncbi:GyrI-like domain-containing protein [Vibrio algarum]|uniref:GyrI-like domain-containing protein n=1 Tax=Vibrio algarum TaxID=3020714 RepID=A0ABT4YW15_9VIBR|nr:GyrI-like domain-containing protein [Vibrio sp. KJ40-1]MDB1125703.1 GyrI-like domain-containing protein [Vibrio sp. KJ40-1]